MSRGSAGDYQADERAGVARLSWRVSGRWAGRCHAAQLAIIRQMSGQVSRGSAGEYQADERGSCFFHDPANVGNLISGSSAFSKTSLNIRNVLFLIEVQEGKWNILNLLRTRVRNSFRLLASASHTAKRGRVLQSYVTKSLDMSKGEKLRPVYIWIFHNLKIVYVAMYNIDNVNNWRDKSNILILRWLT